MNDDELIRRGETLGETFKEEVLEDPEESGMFKKHELELGDYISLPFQKPELNEIYTEDAQKIIDIKQKHNKTSIPLDEITLANALFQLDLKKFQCVERFKSGALIAEGQIKPLTPDLERKVIKPRWWSERGMVNFRESTFRETTPSSRTKFQLRYPDVPPPPRTPFVMFTDVRVWDRNTWQKRKTQTAPGDMVSAEQKKPVGRPEKFEWDEFWSEVALKAEFEGLPETQAKLQDDMLAWCLQTWGREPAESTVKNRLSDLYERLRKERKRISEADN